MKIVPKVLHKSTYSWIRAKLSRVTKCSKNLANKQIIIENDYKPYCLIRSDGLSLISLICARSFS
eukprot:snap_masked-scaffold_14-processed-gene-8.16-mRNA-1 protein AED:1.00 eAED:1.00 QI:0/0/0/0/1/1/2/0/64